MEHKDTERFSLSELCTLADQPTRTVRYYIQEGIIKRPEGAKRGAYYTRDHLEQLLTIRKWQSAGLNLDRIRELLVEPEGGLVPPPRAKRPGDVSMRSHITLCPGVELIVDPQDADLSPEAVRSLARKAMELLDTIKKEASE
jgi:DNA-binding transcriptional MerR regulator